MGVPQPVIRQDPTGITYTLYYSTDSGDANLTVGFYLVGPPNIIEYVKTWDFGDGDIEEDHSIVQNHMYGPTAALGVNGSVTVNDPTGNKMVEIPFQITMANRKVRCISNLYQTEGAIIDGSSVGVAIDETGSNGQKLVWDWDGENGAGEPLDTGIDLQNPNHIYKTSSYDPPYNGIVKLLDTAGNILDQWNFSVMVIPISTNISRIDCVTIGGSAIQVGSTVSFEVQPSTGLQPDCTCVWNIQYIGSKNITPPPMMPQSGSPIPKCTFTDSGNYLVTCRIIGRSGSYLKVSTTVHVEEGGTS